MNDPRPDPGRRVTAAFERIAATRMRDFPLSNAVLHVETVGFRYWNDLWVGVLVTPWAMNLLLLPAGNAAFRTLATGQEQAWQFPSGEYVFYGLDEEGIGPYQMCSLFSPMTDLQTQDNAVEIAGEVMQALFAEPNAVPAVAASAGVSRRAFMFGRGERAAG